MPLLAAAAGPMTRLWHGGREAFDRFRIPEGAREPAVWLAPTAREAMQWAEAPHIAGRGGSPQLYSVRVPSNRIESYRWRDFDPDPIYTPEVMRRILDAARGRSPIARIEGVRNFEGGPLSTSYAVSDPALIEILRRFGQ
jgi:hypothetical protein